jgi:molybdopterin molybdotransferase
VQSEVIGAVTKGEGVSAAGGDAERGQVLLQAGHRLRASDVAALTLLGIDRVEVRAPRVAVIAANARVRDASLAMIASAVERFGAISTTHSSERGADHLERTLHEADADGIITIGGTGCGASDRTIGLMREAGEVHVHGIAMSPGETCAIGSIKGHPVLMLPGRLDAALSAWLLIGQALLGRMANTTGEHSPREVSLSRKISSTLGMSEAVLIRETADGFVPIGSKSFPLRALAAAHGWALVPPDSEGFPAGARIALHSLP